MSIDIFDVVPAPAELFSVYLNTGTLYDLACGMVYPCKNNYVVNGGMSNILGIAGRSQTYKSTIVESFMARVLSIYPDVKCIEIDSENNKTSTSRYNHFAINGVEVSKNIRLYDTTTDDINSVHDKIMDIVNFKTKHAKDMMIETPFLDKNGDPIRMMTPTLFGIDSFTALQADGTMEFIGKNDLDDSALNTIWMKSGKNKTLFMRQLVQYARKANIYFFLTAHIGENRDLGSHMPPAKQLQFFGQKDKLKDVGSQFEFLCNTLIKTNSASTLIDANKECQYPAEFSTATELNRVNAAVVRNKINASGSMIPFIVSQHMGIMNQLTHLQYLKDQKDEVLFTQRGGNMTSNIYPEVTFTRNNIRAKSEEDYKLERALDLSAQLIFIKNCWTSFSLPVDISTPLEKFVDFIMSDKETSNEILSSRSYWTYNKKDPRPMFTIFDILEMINTGKKPGSKTMVAVKEDIVDKSTKNKTNKAA